MDLRNTADKIEFNFFFEFCVHKVLPMCTLKCLHFVLCCRIALVLGCLHLEKNGETMQKMELENAKLKEAHMTIAEKMGKQNAS